MEVSVLMNLVNQWVKDILKENYVGVYFHGSVRLGHFRFEQSDLDFIIVVKNHLTRKIKKMLWDKMLENLFLFPKKGFEFSVVLKKHCQKISHPVSYELHGSQTWIETYRLNPSILISKKTRFDDDLVSHFNVIHVIHPQCDFGLPANEVFGKIPFEYVMDSNYKDIIECVHQPLKNPTYSILNVCRFYALMKEQLTLSKYDGGKWAIENKIFKHDEVIKLAMDDYHGDNIIVYEEKKVQLFMSESFALIQKEMKNKGFIR